MEKLQSFRLITKYLFEFPAEIGCTRDSDCPSQTACVSGECVNPCALSEPCGRNAFCTVLDTLPVRTMTCVCIQGYEGDASFECTPGMDPQPSPDVPFLKYRITDSFYHL